MSPLWQSVGDGMVFSAVVAGALNTVHAAEPSAPMFPDASSNAARSLFAAGVGETLTTHCLGCHGGGQVEADLNMATFEGLLQGGVSGPAIVPGNAEESLLYRAIAHTQEPFMPYEGDRLPDETLAEIKAWIDAGGAYDHPLVKSDGPDTAAAPKEMIVTSQDRQFWSFQPLARIQPPAVRNAAWVRTAVDRFILAALEAQGLSAAPEADKQTLIRRVWFDLIGLPPTPEEVDAFMQDASPDAYERLVDRLLASPQYGERWARHWLDVARYADSNGYERDEDRPNAYPYRDFVIQALNEDLPYDTFIQWQLAGDELAPDNPLAVAATGFCTAGPVVVSDTPLEIERQRYRYDELDDMLATTGSAMLGLTIGCARCHDHKYDPIPQRDYYRMLAAFTSSQRHERPLGGPAAVALTLTDQGPQPTTSYLLARGDPAQPAEEVRLGFLTVLTPPAASPDRWLEPPNPSSQTTLQRSALARWMTDEAGAGQLLARVAVNRLWQHHFGEGLVRTPGDFGAQGQPPAHPELLDWLSGELIAGGWRLKPIHRLMLTSAAYRQGTTYDAAQAVIDPENRLFWRRRPRRLEAEALRDAILSVSGHLNPQMYGPGVKPPIPADAMVARNNRDAYPQNVTEGPDVWRRSIYLFSKRSVRLPLLETFDSPPANAACARRNLSTVAPQALALLNEEFVREQSRLFAERVRSTAGEDQPDQIALAYRLALGRPPTDAEQASAEKFLNGQTVRRANTRQASTADEGESAAARQLALVDFCQVLFNLNEFIYID